MPDIYFEICRDKYTIKLINSRVTRHLIIKKGLWVMTRENINKQEKMTTRGNFGDKMQTFTIQKNNNLQITIKKDQENYNNGKSFGEIKELKFNFLTGFFNALLLNENKLSDTIRETKTILHRLYERNKLDIFELNAIENLIFKIIEHSKYYLTKSDGIAVNFGDNWKV